MSKDHEVNEQKTVAASYILTFYQEVDLLTRAYAEYESFMKSVDEVMKAQGERKQLSQEELDVIKNMVARIRELVNMTKVRVDVILPYLKEAKAPKDFTKQHGDVLKSYIINIEALNVYVKSLNQILVSGVIQELIETSKRFMEALYGDNAAETSK